MRELTFLSTSRQCFTSLVFPETVVLSMLVDKNLTVSDIASAVQLEERPRPNFKLPGPKGCQSVQYLGLAQTGKGKEGSRQA